MFLYTDWGCLKNGKDWKWAYWYAVIKDNSLIDFWYWINSSTTNNRMELMAIYRWLLHILESWYIGPIIIRSDSQYCIAVCSGEQKAAQNRELVGAIKDLIFDMPYHDISREWVKGHADDTWNNYVDAMCTKALSIE